MEKPIHGEETEKKLMLAASKGSIATNSTTDSSGTGDCLHAVLPLAVPFSKKTLGTLWVAGPKRKISGLLDRNQKHFAAIGSIASVLDRR